MDNNANINSILLSVNFGLRDYANWVKSIDYTTIEDVKSEFLNTITITNLKLNNISDIQELVILRNNINELLDKCLTMIKDKERLYKLSEYNKFIKPISDTLKPIKNINLKIFEEKERELHAISSIFENKLGIETFLDVFKTKADTLQSNISTKQAELSNLKNKPFYIEFENDKKKIIDTAHQLKSELKQFDDHILSTTNSAQLIDNIILELSNPNQNPTKSNMNILISSEAKDYKSKLYHLIEIDMFYIEKEEQKLSTLITNFLGDISTAFNQKWIAIPNKEIEHISKEDQILLESELKHANAEIDHLSKLYGEFLDKIYGDYPTHLSNKIFNNIEQNKYK